MRQTDSDPQTVTIALDRSELDTLVGALVFLFSQMAESDYHPILGVDRPEAFRVRDALSTIRRESRRPDRKG